MRTFLNRTNLLLIFIVLISIVLRFLYLDKIGGLWYDEIISYKEASQPSILSVISYTLNTDVSFPLYQVILHCWSKIFSFSDYSLRLFSVICGILTVLTSYFIGKELKSKETGLICASVFAVNSFLIYYSQEVRMYSLLTLFLSLYLFFVVKIKNDYRNKWNYFGATIFALAVICSYTISFLFIASQFLILLIYLINHNKEDRFFIIKQILISSIILGIFCLPLLNVMHKYAGIFNGVWNDWSSILVFLQDWFTPIIKIFNPINYFETFFSTIGFSTLIFIFIPILLAIYSIIYSIRKDKFALVILSGVIFFLLGEIIAANLTLFKIAPRYTIIVLPNLLVLLSYGLSLLNNKKHIKTIFISLFLGINLFYLIFMSDSAFRMQRCGFKPLAQMINSAEPKENDFIVVWNRQEILDKYVTTKLNVLSLLKNFAYTSEVILGQENKLNKLSLDKRKTLLRPYFSSAYIPQNTAYIINFIYNHAKPNQKFIITTAKTFDAFTQDSFTKLVNDDKSYNETSLNDLLTIKALIDIKLLSYKKFHFVKKLQDEQFVVIVFKK